MSDPDSGDLLLVAARDTAAFQRILGRWKKPVYAAFERMRDPSSATEMAAGVFVRLYQTAGDYGPETPFVPWLFALVGRAIQGQPAEPLMSIPVQKLLESHAAQTAFLRSALSALPPLERTAFILTRIARLPVPIAARAMSMTEPDLRRRLVRAMEALSGFLEPVFSAQASQVAGKESEMESQ